MAWQNIPNNPYWQYDDAPLDPGGAQTALWETSTNGVRTSVRGEQIYVNCKHKLLHPTQDSIPNEINKTFWANFFEPSVTLIDELQGTVDGTTITAVPSSDSDRLVLVPLVPDSWYKSVASQWKLGVGNTWLFNTDTANANSSDGALAKIIKLAELGLTNENQLQISMTYNAWNGTTPIDAYVHIWGLVDKTSLATTRIANLGSNNANMFAGNTGSLDRLDYYNLGSGTKFEDHQTQGFASNAAIKLLNQDTGTSSIADAVSFSTIIDLSGYSLDTLAQYDYFVIGIAKNVMASTDNRFAIHDIKVTAGSST